MRAAAAPATTLIREDLPLVGARRLRAGRHDGVAQRRADPRTDRHRPPRRGRVLTLMAALVLAVILYFVFRTAQDRISRQTAALVEATRRDPTTGLLNHGAIVEALGEALEAARASTTSHRGRARGHRQLPPPQRHARPRGRGRGARPRGDERMSASVPETALLGRYGPDEILVFGAGGTDDLHAPLEVVRTLAAGRHPPARRPASRCPSRSAPASRRAPATRRP